MKRAFTIHQSDEPGAGHSLQRLAHRDRQRIGGVGQKRADVLPAVPRNADGHVHIEVIGAVARSRQRGSIEIIVAIGDALNAVTRVAGTVPIRRGPQQHAAAASKCVSRPANVDVLKRRIRDGNRRGLCEAGQHHAQKHNSRQVSVRAFEKFPRSERLPGLGRF